MKQIPRIIAIAGPAGSGKDTVANFIHDVNSKYLKYRFADPIKRTIKELFGFTEEQIEGRESKELDDPFWGFSPRLAMQRFGTEFGRDLKDDIWLKFADRALALNGRLVISDCRFENEAKWVRDNGGVVIQLFPTPSADHRPVAPHRSEGGIQFNDETIYVFNDLKDRELLETIIFYHLKKLGVV